MISLEHRGEPIHDPKWLTREGAEQSAKRVIAHISAALRNANTFYAYIKSGSGYWPQSPVEHATHDGMQQFGAFEDSPEEFSRACLRAIVAGGYPVPTVIAASVFMSQQVTIARLAQPEESFFVCTAFDRILENARTEGSRDNVIGALERSLSGNVSFAAYLTPQGRVDQSVGYTTVILSQPECMAMALDQIHHGVGMGGPSAYGEAIAKAPQIILA